MESAETVSTVPETEIPPPRPKTPPRPPPNAPPPGNSPLVKGRLLGSKLPLGPPWNPPLPNGAAPAEAACAGVVDLPMANATPATATSTATPRARLSSREPPDDRRVSTLTGAATGTGATSGAAGWNAFGPAGGAHAPPGRVAPAGAGVAATGGVG